MRPAYRRMSLAVWSLLVCGLCGMVQAETPLKPPGPESWPSFRNGNAQRGIAGSSLPEKPEVLWQIRSQDGIVGTAAIVGDHVYAPTLSGYLLCLDRKSGEQLWRYRSIEDEDPNAFAPGFKAAPLITETRIYIGDEDGVMHALDRATGKKQWIFTTQGEIAGCPAIVGEKLIFGSHDSFLYCLNAKDGSKIWSFQTLDRVNCSAAISGQYTFIAGCDEHLRVIDIETGKEQSDIPLESYLIASPAVVDDMLYVGTHNGEVLAVNWKEEKIVWRYKDPQRDFPYHASCAVTEDYVIVGGQDKQVHCINRKTGEKVWIFRTKAQVNSSPVVVGDRVVVGSNDGNVYTLSLKDGSELWKHNLGQSVSAGPAVGEGCLVIGAEGRNGALFCFGTK